MSSLHDNPWRWQTTPLRRPRNGLRRLNNRNNNNNNTTPRKSSGSSSSRMVEGRATTITIATITCLPEDYIGSEILCSLSRRSCCHHHQHHQHHQHQHPQHHHQHPPRERTTNRVSFLLYRRLHCLLLLPLPSTRIITIKMRKMADVKQNEKKNSKKKKRKRGKKSLCGITGEQK